jgi:type III secretion protein U
MSEKTEQPTQKKLDDARDKGQTAKSKDMVHVFLCAALVELGLAMAPTWRALMLDQINLSLARVGDHFEPALTAVIGAALINALVLILPVALIALFLVVAGNLAQTGFLFTPQAMALKFEKFNPVENAKQIFSARGFTQFIFNVLKSALVVWLVWRFGERELPKLLLLSTGTLQDSWEGALGMVRLVERSCIGSFLIFAVADLGLQKYFHRRSLRMSIEDLKQEYKEMEGDPHVKAHRRMVAHELANAEPTAKTRKANVVVVNPTHFAVALSYLPEQMPLPLVLARGQGPIAQEMIAAARAAHIPVVRYVPLARALYATGREGYYVPSAHLAPVALLYRALHELLAAADDLDAIPEIDPEAAQAYLQKLGGSK